MISFAEARDTGRGEASLNILESKSGLSDSTVILMVSHKLCLENIMLEFKRHAKTLQTPPTSQSAVVNAC